MSDVKRRYVYVAVDETGRRTRGELLAADDALAFVRLKQLGLSPVKINAVRGAGASTRSGRTMADQEIALFLSNLAALLKAGADMRTALDIVGGTAGGAGSSLARNLSTEISGGGAIDAAFEQQLPRRADFVAALVAAGEASGDLAGGLERAAELMAARLRLREQLASAVSYPAFVLASTILAVAAILLVVIPTLAPLVEDMGGKAPFALGLMIKLSNAIRRNALAEGACAAAAVLVAFLAWRFGLLAKPVERFLLDGPFATISRRIAFGGYAIALGSVLSGGAAMTEALRLALRVVRLGVARERLEGVAVGVREGAPLSSALETVRGFPSVVLQMAAVGEASGALGAMLERAGRLEEAEAIRRIEAAGRILGPALIVALGLIIGLVMVGLLSGVTQLGEIAAG